MIEKFHDFFSCLSPYPDTPSLFWLLFFGLPFSFRPSALLTDKYEDPVGFFWLYLVPQGLRFNVWYRGKER